MVVGGVSIIAILGFANIILLVFQLLSGLKKIKVPMGVHKKTGIILLIIATFHGLLAILANS